MPTMNVSTSKSERSWVRIEILRLVFHDISFLRGSRGKGKLKEVANTCGLAHGVTERLCETPSSNLQAPEKFQAPSSKSFWRGSWGWEFRASFEFLYLF